MSAPATDTAPSSEAMPARRRLSVPTSVYLLVIVVVLVVAFTFAGGIRFVSEYNLQSMAINAAGLLVLAVGMTIVLGAGQIDISVGANLVLASVVGAKVILLLTPTVGHTAAIWIGVVASVACGVIGGIINALIVTRLKVVSLVATLGTTGVFFGAANVITNGSNVPGLPPQLQADFGFKTVLGIPLVFVVALLVCVVGWWVISVTSTGRHLLAVGSDEKAAQRSGVNVRASKTTAFVIAGACAGLAGFFDLAQFGTTSLAGHSTTPLAVISAVIIGGTSLFGGRVQLGGAIVATFIPTVLLSGLIFIGLPSFYQDITIGAILVIAVWLDGIRRAQREE